MVAPKTCSDAVRATWGARKAAAARREMNDLRFISGEEPDEKENDEQGVADSD